MREIGRVDKRPIADPFDGVGQIGLASLTADKEAAFLNVPDEVVAKCCFATRS